MVRGIGFETPKWAKQHLKSRKAVYFKAVKAQAALAALESKESVKVEEVDAAAITNHNQEQDDAAPTSVFVEQEKKEEEGEESKKEENKVGDDDDDDWYVDLGHSDFWPCYLRFMFIAAYKMIQSEWSDEEDATKPQVLSSGADSIALVPLKPPKKLVLQTILRVCPPSTASVPPSIQTKQMQDFMSSFIPGYKRDDEHGSLHLNMCNDDQEVISVLGAAGLGPLCGMCRDHHMSIAVLDAGRISNVAALLNKLKPYFASCAEHLAGTPFSSASGNLDEDKTMVEITETFFEIASLDCGVTGTVGV